MIRWWTQEDEEEHETDIAVVFECVCVRVYAEWRESERLQRQFG